MINYNQKIKINWFLQQQILRHIHPSTHAEDAKTTCDIEIPSMENIVP